MASSQSKSPAGIAHAVGLGTEVGNEAQETQFQAAGIHLGGL
jgi:hypothetical protein